MNNALCNSCGKLAPADQVERDGKVFLAKDCPDCGPTETLISSDARRYYAKRELDVGYPYHGCQMNCTTCRHAQTPQFCFLDVTNRCNLNCPICIDGVPGLGFEFEPSIEYFDKILKGLAQNEPKPTIAFFGGEPTVRDDLLDMIKLARSYGLRTRVLTNGLKLADMDYCRQLVMSRTTILMSHDGENPETYRRLRGSAKALDRKQKAMENFRQIEEVRRGRIILIMCISKGINDDELPAYLDFCHRHRDFLSCIHLMPLAHTWESEALEIEPERITPEDIEQLLEDAFPGETVEFVPAGYVAEFVTVSKYLKRAALPFLGAHPNCESVYLLVSDGERYRPISHYLKGSLPDLGKDLLKLERKLVARERSWQKGLFGRLLGALRLKNVALGLLARVGTSSVLMRHARLGRLFKGKGLGKVGHAVLLTAKLFFGRKGRKAIARHSNAQGVLQIIILPFEDDYVLESERLERCPNAHTYLDPKTEEIKYVPLCAWRLHNKQILREVAERYCVSKSVGSQDAAETLAAG